MNLLGQANSRSKQRGNWLLLCSNPSLTILAAKVAVVKFTIRVSVAMIASIALLGLPLLFYSQVAYAAPTPDSCFAYTADAPNVGEATITGYYSHENDDPGQPACTRDVEIPVALGGYSLTRIGVNAFNGQQLTSAVIPNSVTAIDDGAFAANQITSMIIPDSVTTIGSVAFGYSMIDTIVFQGSVTNAGDDLFMYTNLNSLTYGGVTYTDAELFTEECFVFDSGTGTIQGRLLGDISTIESHGVACMGTNLVIPSSISGVPVVAIGPGAFYAGNFTSVTLPNTMATIGEQAFEGNSVSSFVIPSSVTSVGNSAFNFQTLPGTANFIGASYGGSAQAVQDISNNVVYVQIYVDPAQNILLGLTDEVVTEGDVGSDLNADGDLNDTVYGQLINPAYVTQSYLDGDGASLQASGSYTGTGLTNYLVRDNPDNDVARYYRVGDSYSTPVAPAIAGYSIAVTPASIASLVAGNNDLVYVYEAVGDGADDTSGGGAALDRADAAYSEREALADSGVSVSFVLFTAASLFAMAWYAVAKRIQIRLH